MSSSKLIEYLDRNKVEYTAINHKTAYTAQEIAAAAHIPGMRLAKSVMLKIDDGMAMAIIPAPMRVNFVSLKEITGAKKVELASENEFKNKFPDCETGAVPPFGNLYGLDVYVDDGFAERMEIAFCAGTHTELIQMTFKEFVRLVQPKIANISWQD